MGLVTLAWRDMPSLELIMVTVLLCTFFLLDCQMFNKCYIQYQAAEIRILKSIREYSKPCIIFYALLLLLTYKSS